MYLTDMTTNTTTAATNVHHEAILEHLETYRSNVEFCREQFGNALRATRHTGAAGSRIWSARVREYEAQIATLESILTYVAEAEA